MSHLDEKRQILSRRELLKVLTATGSAAAFSALPVQWERPVVKVGALPVFAMVSPCLLLNVDGPHGPCQTGGGGLGALYTLSLAYSDPGGNIAPNQAQARLTAEFLPSGPTTVDQVFLSGSNINGSASNGTVAVPVCLDFGSSTSVKVTLLLIDATGANNVEGTCTILNPSGTPRSGETTTGGMVIQ